MMSAYASLTLISIMLLLATEAVAVKPDEAGEDIYQQEFVATESVKEEVIVEEKIVTDNNDNGEAESVEPDEAGEDIYQQDVVPTESVEEEVIVEEEIVTENNGSGEVESAAVEAEVSEDDDTIQGEETVDPVCIKGELYSAEAFPEESIYDEPIAEESIYAVLDKPHKYVSENVERLVTSVDRFFANDALYRYTTDSYVQITGDTLIEERGEVGCCG